MIYAAVAGTAFACALISVALVLPLLRRRGILDVPNVRSSHRVPVPRGGGAGIVAGIVAACILIYIAGFALPPWWILMPTLLIACAGALDDAAGGLPAVVRLTIQVIASGTVIWFGGGLAVLPLPDPFALPLGVAGIPLALLWLVGTTNIYNFLDGIDGYAGTQGVLAGAAVAVAVSDSGTSLFGLAVAGACGGFLCYNWHPARIFMGDVGSTTLGFLFAALPWTATGSRRSNMVLFVALFLWFFLADGVLTIVKRLRNGQKIWTPHKSHLYQQLVAAGIPHHRVVLRISTMTLVVSVITLAAAVGTSAFVAWLALITAIVMFGLYARHVRRITRSSRPVPAKTCAAGAG